MQNESQRKERNNTDKKKKNIYLWILHQIANSKLFHVLYSPILSQKAWNCWRLSFSKPQESQSDPSDIRSVLKCRFLTGRELPKPTAASLGEKSLTKGSATDRWENKQSGSQPAVSIINSSQ